MQTTSNIVFPLDSTKNFSISKRENYVEFKVTKARGMSSDLPYFAARPQ